jgi:paraquat-inducible protein B
MATRATYLKIGLLVLLGGCAFLALGVLIGLQRIHRKYVSFYTYFDEAVTGLDVGSPVRARGVPVGQVGRITFAPDHRMVEVRSDVDVDEMVRLGLPKPGETGMVIPTNLRAQLAAQGLTGQRFMSFDFFDEKTNPPPALSFPPQKNYIPAARSVQKSLEEAATTAMDGVASLVETLRRAQVGEKLVATTSEADEVLRLLHQMLQSLDHQQLPQRTSATVEELREAAGRINELLARVDGDAGLLATTQRSVGAVGEAGRQASETTRNLSETLEEIRSAAAAIRALADRLERDPDMLLKGRGKGNAP